MSEKCPRAWGVCIFWPSGTIEYESVWATQDMATRSAYNWVTPTKVVELIPLPEHETLVAAAVAAERERLTSIIRSIYPCDIEDSRPTFSGATLRYVLAKISEVPE